MKKKSLYVLFPVLAGVVFFCLFLSAIYPRGTPLPLSLQERVTQAIEKLAKADAEAGKPIREETALISIFGKEAEAAGISNLEIVETYEQVYKASQIPPDPIKDLFRNFFKFENRGWVAAGIAFLLFLLRKKPEEWFTHFFNWLTEKVYLRVAGLRPFWIIALRRYRKALERNYGELKIPFRPESPAFNNDRLFIHGYKLCPPPFTH